MEPPRHTPDLEPTVNAGTLFRRHASFVANFLARIGVGPGELDDVVQDVFMIAHKKGGFVPGSARPTTWLASIALKVNANRRRTQRRARVRPDAELVARARDDAASPAEVVEHRQSVDRVRQALASLDEDRRAVFVLFEMQGESSESIAGGLGIPLGTVYSRLHHARKQFRKAHARLSAVDNRVRHVATLAAAIVAGACGGWSW